MSATADAVIDNIVWRPSREHLTSSNLAELMRRVGVSTYDAFLDFAIEHPDRFWHASLEHLGIAFDAPPESFVDLSRGKPWARFFPEGRFNFARACLEPSSRHDGSNMPALIWENEAGDHLTLTYADLNRRTLDFAAGLQRLGIKAGDRVGLLLPNIPEAVIAFLAIGYIGAISVPLYSGFGSEPAVQRLSDARACCLISADGFIRRGAQVRLVPTVAAISERVPELKTIVMVTVTGEPMAGVPHAAWADVERQTETSPPAPAETATDDPFMLIYTSGTTGRPKGALHPHAGFPLRIAQDAAYLFDFHSGDRLFWMSDMGWMVGPLSIIAPLMLNGTLVLYDGAPDQPDLGRLRAIAGRHGVTHFGSAPTAIRAIAAREAESLAAPLPTLRILITAGEVIDPETFDWYFYRFGGARAPVINYTGGTEVSGAIMSNVVMRPIARSRFNSIAPGMNAGVVDEDGRRIFGKPGELAIFDPFVGMTNGFWGDSDRYIESYWSRIPNMWVHGDLVLEEKDGQLELIGRSDDVMKISGKRVGPSEIEGLVVDGKIITEAFAVGVPDAASGEALVLCVHADPSTLVGTSVEKYVSDMLVLKMGRPYKPAAVIEVSRLPKTRNGKAVRRLVRQAWLGRPAGNVAALEDPLVFDELVAACAAYRGKREN